MELSEYNIIKACQQGDMTGFGQLYDAYIRKIYNFIFFRTHHKETAEDITSQVFLKALKNIRGFSAGKGTFSSWLYRIARNTVIDYYRTHKTNLDLEQGFDIGSPEDLEASIDIKQSVKQVQEYVARLKPDQRDIITLRAWDGLSYKEIAEVLGKTEGSCRMMFSRTVAQLQKDIPIALFFLLIIPRVWTTT